MKKTSMRAFSFTLVLVFILSFTIQPHLSANPMQAMIIFVQGQVQYKNPADVEWKAASKGTFLIQGAEILTGTDSLCELGLDKEAKRVVKLKADSKATIVSLDPVNIDLKSGRIFTLVRDLPKGKEFKISTPTAVAAVRGTAWEMEVQPDGDMRGEVAHGLVEFESVATGEQVEIGEGMGLEVEESGEIEKFELPEQDKQELKVDEQAVVEHSQEFAVPVAGEGEKGKDDAAGEKNATDSNKVGQGPNDGGSGPGSGSGHDGTMGMDKPDMSKMSESEKAMYESMTPEEREKAMADHMSREGSMTEAERSQMETDRAQWESATPEEREKMMAEYGGHEMTDAERAQYESMSEEDRERMAAEYESSSGEHEMTESEREQYESMSSEMDSNNYEGFADTYDHSGSTDMFDESKTAAYEETISPGSTTGSTMCYCPETQTYTPC